jgi:hypothetical protein
MSARTCAVIPLLLAAALVAPARAEDWVYAAGYITNSLGWKIQVNAPSGGSTTLSTVDNNGMVKSWPAAGDRPDGLYTLDLSQPIVDAADPAKTYSLATIGYYEFNGGCNIGTLVLPDTLAKWKFASALGICDRQGTKIDTILPKDFSKDILWSGGSAEFGWAAPRYTGELHLGGVLKTKNSGLSITHGGVQRVFFDEVFMNFNSTTFANSGATRFDLFFRGDPPGGMDDANWGTGNRAYLHVPVGNAAWEDWLAAKSRAFADSDRDAFESRFPGHPEPDYVVSAAGKFQNAYVRLWHVRPGLEIASPYPVAAGRVSPDYGTYPCGKTGDTVALSCPASVTEDGVEHLCRGYRLERTSGADWAAGTSVESADLELTVAYDTAEAIRVTWLWEPQVAASVTVTSDRGDGFGAVEPGYGLCISFPGGARTFSATGPGYDAAERTRYRATGYRLTDEAGVTTQHAGTSFGYDTSMGRVVLEWLWSPDGYELRTSSPGCLPVEVSPALDEEGYGDIGAVYSLAAPSGAGEAAFAHWSGNVAAIASDTARTVSATLSRPLTLVAEPRCAWRFPNGSTMITNALGWQIRGSVSGSNFRIGQSCVIAPATVAWNLDAGTHWLDLSLPVAKDSDGSALTIDGCGGNIPFYRADGTPRLGKLVLGADFRRWPFDGHEIFGNQDRLAEIEPAFLPDNAVASSSGGKPSFGAIPYRGDVFLRCPPATTLNNCNLKFTHRGTQNVFVGTNLVTISETAFSWSYANYRLHFDGFPAGLASSRNGSGDYRFYVLYRSNDATWACYLEENARKFVAADREGFAARFPEDAAAGKWPYYAFTGGFFSGTWARPLYPTGTILIVR